MTKIKLVATDMDHTLLTEESTLPEGLEERLNALSELGIRFAVASGRPIYTLANIFPTHRDDFLFMPDNGGAIYDGRRLLEISDLPQDPIKKMVTLGLNTPDVQPMICARDAAVVRAVDRESDAVFREFYHELNYVDNLLDWRGDANKVTFYLPKGNAETVFKDVMEPAFGANFDVVVSGDVWIDITPKGVNKGNALRKVSADLHISLDEMIAFGDAANDKTMLQTVGYGFLMANAPESMSSYGQFRAPANTEAGVLTVLDALIEGKGEASSLMRFTK